MKTNSNSYTIIYSVIIVVIVAFLLAFVFQALKPMQDANVALDKKKQILNSLNIRDLNDAQADAKYKEVVVADRVIDEKERYFFRELLVERMLVSSLKVRIIRRVSWPYIYVELMEKLSM